MAGAAVVVLAWGGTKCPDGTDGGKEAVGSATGGRDDIISVIVSMY
jgi:hypothetical protein